MFQIEAAGQTETGRAFDVRTSRGGYAGLVVENFGRGCRVFFNSSATRGSKRIFADIQDALGYIADRRTKKGWRN